MKNILLVEDDPFIQDIYSTQLRKEDYRVDIANSVAMAEEKIKMANPDLILLDLNLNKLFPGPKDGLDILEVLQKDPTTKKIKVIVLSNYTQEEYPELANLSEFGVLKYLLKVNTAPADVVRAAKEVLL